MEYRKNIFLSKLHSAGFKETALCIKLLCINIFTLTTPGVFVTQQLHLSPICPKHRVQLKLPIL